MSFWVTTALLAALAAFWIALPLLRRGGDGVGRSSYDVQIYKDQLKEVERDLSRGVLTEAEANASRTEISRRLLVAADKAEAEAGGSAAPKGATIGLLLAVTVAFIGGFYLYSRIGAPGFPDLPLAERMANRPSQEMAEQQVAATQGELPPADPEHLALIEQLKDVLKDRPNDLTGYRLLADNLAQLGRYAEARVAQDRVIELLGDSATAEDYASQAEIMVIAAGWYVSPEAEDALTNAVQIDQFNPRARFYVGMALWQRGRPDQTYQLWSGLLAEGHDAPWVGVIEQELDAVAAEAGITTRGPSQADIDAAADMTEDERMDMIRGMVANLSDRLANEGGTPEEWAQLIGALGVLGETEQAAAIWDEAQTVFEGNAEALTAIRTAAEGAGVAE